MDEELVVVSQNLQTGIHDKMVVFGSLSRWCCKPQVQGLLYLPPLHGKKTSFGGDGAASAVAVIAAYTTASHHFNCLKWESELYAILKESVILFMDS